MATAGKMNSLCLRTVSDTRKAYPKLDIPRSREKSNDLAALEQCGPEHPHPGPLYGGEGVHCATLAFKPNAAGSVKLRRKILNCDPSPVWERAGVRVLRYTLLSGARSLLSLPRDLGL